MPVHLHGYQYSVYAWIARMALAAKGVDYTWHEVNPFAPDVPDTYRDLHPFKRVPVLQVDRVVIYETSAITRYVDEAFDGPPLQPRLPVERARANQVISIVDSYAYWPFVRQVFAHGVFARRLGRPAAQSEVEAGLKAAPHILGALENLATDRARLVTDDLSLADIHLAPMMAYFIMHEDGHACLMRHGRLAKWWSSVSASEAFALSAPVLPEAPTD